MRSLAIETAGRVCSLALFDGTALIAHAHEPLARGHAERLLPAIAALPDGGRADRVLVDTGPGSFTGVRIGHAAAHGLALAWGASVHGFSSLALVDATAAALDEGWRTRARAVVVEGGHGHYFVGAFAAGSRVPATVASLLPEDAAQAVGALPLAGNRAAALAALTGGEALALEPDARFALDAGWAAGDNATITYGRGADAKPLADR